MAITVRESLISPGRQNRPDSHCPEYITIHETANLARGANREAHERYLSSTTEKVSWHYTVDRDGVTRHLPDWERGYHAGDGASGTGNAKSIGIEMCVNCDGDYEATLKNTAQLVRELMGTYGIPLKNVVQHHHWTGKDCPKKLREMGRWEEFLSMVQGGGQWKNGIYFRKYDKDDFCILWWDGSKRTGQRKNYSTSTFFLGSKAGGVYFTEPVGNLVADIDLGRYRGEVAAHLGQRTAAGKIRYGTSSTWDTKFRGKKVSTLVVTENGVHIGQYSAPPEDARYAACGLPVVAEGRDVSWTKDVLPQGWGTDTVYATAHLCLGIAGESIYELGIRTKSANCIKSSELCGKITALGLGITDAIMLDGGGSFLMDENGKNVMVEDGALGKEKNRQINCMICRREK